MGVANNRPLAYIGPSPLSKLDMLVVSLHPHSFPFVVVDVFENRKRVLLCRLFFILFGGFFPFCLLSSYKKGVFGWRTLFGLPAEERLDAVLLCKGVSGRNNYDK